ncbi:MAG TPA: serine/threonine-protein kinase [Methylomirabilota bacterium]|nr:serine/threonine-protein kinase [Methylomirabilota bacterium]
MSRFEILELLGEGAMGVVYRARDPVLERDVALKLIRPEIAGEAKSRSRFLRECRAAATINHPNVATIYEAGETDDGLLYLASELVVGETLKDRLLVGPLPLEEVIDLGIQLAEALDAAHRKGAVHRDIKPSNLMVDDLGRLKVLDFGLARLGASEGSERGGPGAVGGETVDMTQDGAVVGTPAYMSPEQASAMAVDGRTDIFSAGCVLHELVTGRSPFHAGSVPETLRRVICEEPLPLRSSVGEEFSGLDRVLQWAMAKDRDLRLATGRQLADALGELDRDREADPSVPGPEEVRSRRRTLMVGSATMLLALAILTLFLWQWSRPSLAFADHDRVLVGDVENLTGEVAFGLALRTAIETDLKQSPYASLYRRHQVDETLRSMRRTPDTFIDEQVGRDICRFAGIRALILPRIVEAGGAYELQAAVVDPQTGRRVDRVQVVGASRDDMLADAIDELTRELRTRLGESLESIERTDFPIADVTTSSWEALHYFASANEAWGRGTFDEAVRLYELALELDPQFATCRGSLALLLIQFGDQPERGAEELRRALADGETLPRDEYLMLRAATRQFADRDLVGALEEYRLVADLYPRNGAARNNMGRILLQLGRYGEAAEAFEKAAEIDPKGTVPLINLALLYISALPDAAAAERACRRLIAIDDEVANYQSLLGWAVAAQGRFDEAAEILGRALELDPDDVYALPNLGFVLVAAGNPGSAVLYLRQNLDRVRRAGQPHMELGAFTDLAVCLAEAGEDEAAAALVDDARRRLDELRAPEEQTLGDHAFLAQLLAAAGRMAEAERELAKAQSMEVDDAQSRLDLARACAMLGRRGCAIENTRLAFEQGYGDPYLPMLIPSMNSLLGDPEFMALFPGHGAAEAGPEPSG